MRMIHPPRRFILLAVALAAAPAAAQNGVAVDASHLNALQARLNGFAAALPAEERALWNDLLLRAASAPAAGADVRVSPILQIGPGGGCDGGGVDEAAGRVSSIVQGGRTGAPASGIVVQGGRTPATGIVVQGGRQPAEAPGQRGGTVVQGGRTGGRPGTPGAEAPRPTGNTGAVSIGPKQDDPARPGRTGAVAIGPKQDDPGAPRPGSAVSIGPKQDDPAPPPQSLGRRIAELSQQLGPEERGALEWLLTRAATAPEGRPGTPGGRPGTPGGLASTPAPEGQPGRPATVPAGAIPGGRPGTPGGPQPMAISLRQALGIDALAIGPKQDDPTPPPPAQRWMLRY